MKQIDLLSVELINFGSFQHEFITFDNTPGLKHVTGENKVEPRLGANGAGKSTIFNGVAFCLTGLSVNGTRASELISFGEKQTAVIVRLQIDGYENIIKRTSPPNRLYLNTEQIEQKELDDLIGLSKQRFFNSVLFGQNCPLFIDLSIPQRGELLDEVLELEYWMDAADTAATKISTKQNELKKQEVSIARIEGQIESLQSIESLQEQSQVWEANRNEEIERILQKIAEQENKLIELPSKAKYRPSTDKKNRLFEEVKKLQNEQNKCALSIATLKSKQHELEEQAKFLVNNETCPVCKQNVDPEFVDNHLVEIDNKLQENANKQKSLLDQQNNLGRQIRETHALWEEECERYNRRFAQVVALETQLANEQQELNRLEKSAVDLNNQENPYTKEIDRQNEQKDNLLAKLVIEQQLQEKLNSDIAAFDYWKQAFKRVRLYCMNKVLNQLHFETMNAANSLGLIGWNIEFSTETETKTGRTKTGVQVVVTSPNKMQGSLNIWSGGEGQRIRLCSARGFAALLQRLSGVIYNFEIWDEPSAWLSPEGIEDLLQSFQTYAETYKKSVYICDHRGLIYSGFSNIMKVVKDEKGSRVELA